jgi:long-chain acyl-CoA synthetase
VAAIHLAPEPFAVENDMMTPTFKLKRPQAQARYQDVLADMYSKLPEM